MKCEKVRKKYIKENTNKTLTDKNLKKEIDKLSSITDRINKINSSNNHLTLLLLLDCMQERSFSIAEKLEYLNQSYENLIEPYSSLYLPMPIVSKRIQTSNLMLYFNKKLNEKYNTLKTNFFKIENSNENKEEGVFSTWDFSAHDHVKNIDDTNRVFINLSFWFYEMQIFYPIAFHEIAHSLYYSLKEKNKDGNNKDSDNKDILLTENDRNKIKKALFIENEDNIFNSLFIDLIYQDIVADFCAYSISGTSYIFALFFSAFMVDIHKNFYLYLS